VEPATATPLKTIAGGWARDFLDPFTRNAASNIRYEILRGVGDDAVAIVEPADPSRGVVDSGALLIVRRRSRQAVAFSASLATRDRGEALRILEQLGSTLATRME
jgi:hypothetical protein